MDERERKILTKFVKNKYSHIIDFKELFKLWQEIASPLNMVSASEERDLAALELQMNTVLEAVAFTTLLEYIDVVHRSFVIDFDDSQPLTVPQILLAVYLEKKSVKVTNLKLLLRYHKDIYPRWVRRALDERLSVLLKKQIEFSVTDYKVFLKYWDDIPESKTARVIENHIKKILLLETDFCKLMKSWLECGEDEESAVSLKLIFENRINGLLAQTNKNKVYPSFLKIISGNKLPAYWLLKFNQKARELLN